MLTYDPNAPAVSWQVPKYPEALRGADTFDVYTGDLATASDLSQATPMECSVPTGRPPVPGEHLTVTDTTPVPQPGQGRYFVTEVSYQAQRRAGRQSVNGVLQGRNPAALTGVTEKRGGSAIMPMTILVIDDSPQCSCHDERRWSRKAIAWRKLVTASKA